MSGTLLSVVIIEYFSLEEIDACLKGIKTNLDGISHEIIISSNSCYDSSLHESIRSRFPDALFIFNERNGGFAYGMNRGLETAKGKYLVIANPDAVVLNGFGEMIRFMEEHPEVGAIGPQIKDISDVIQDTCRNYVSIQSLLFRHVRRKFRDVPVREFEIDHNLIQTVDWLSGAFIMVSRNAYIKTNGLDEKYFMYAEDLDWCSRIRRSGYEIVYFPSMKVIFSGSRAARRFNNFTWIFLKSHFRYWFKFGFFSGYPKREEIVFKNV